MITKLTYLLLILFSSSLVTSLSDQSDNVGRHKRGWDWVSPTERTATDNGQNGVTEQSQQCPEPKSECPNCLSELTKELDDTICDNYLVAEVVLTSGQYCNQLKAQKIIKSDGYLELSSHPFSMSKDCGLCREVFGKSVILVTSHTAYDYSNDGYSFGDETYIIQNADNIRNCSDSALDHRRSLVPIEQPIFVETPSQETIATTPEPITSTEPLVERSLFEIITNGPPVLATVVPPPVIQVYPTPLPAQVDQNQNEISGKINHEEEKGRRNVEVPVAPAPVDSPPVGQTGGDSASPVDGPSQPQTHDTRGAPNMPSYGNQAVNPVANQYPMDYPHTQNEYNNPIYSPYHKPPGYLNTGFFTAQALQYGAERPPAVNPSYYYESRNQVYEGPRYQPSRLNPKPVYQPFVSFGAIGNVVTGNYTSALPQNYGSRPTIGYGQPYQPLPSYSPPPLQNYSTGYSVPSIPQTYANTYASNPMPQKQYATGYSSQTYQTNNGYGIVNGYKPMYSTNGYNNYGSPSYPTQTSSNYPKTSQTNYGSQPSVANYGYQSSVPNYGSQPLVPNYGSSPPVSNYGSYSPVTAYGSQYGSDGYQNKYARSLSSDYSGNRHNSTQIQNPSQYSQQSYTTAAYDSYTSANHTSDPSKRSHHSVLSNRLIQSANGYGSQPTLRSSYESQSQYSVPSYGAQQFQTSSYAPNNYNPGPYSGPQFPSYSSSYSPPSDSYGVSNSYGGVNNLQTYSSVQPIPSYGYSLSQPYASGYTGLRSVSSVYNSPNDYFASSSDIVNTTELCPPIADTCPKCIEDMAEPDLIDSICDYDFIILSSSDDHNRTEKHNPCRQAFIAEIVVDNKSWSEGESFLYSIGGRCQCQHLMEPSVILLTRSQFWTKSGVILNDQSLVLKNDPINMMDIQKKIEHKTCQ